MPKTLEPGAEYADQCRYGRELADQLCEAYARSGNLPMVSAAVERASGGVRVGLIARLFERAL